MKIKVKDFKIFIRSLILSFVAIICISIIYLGIYFSYEQMSKTCFSDTRSAVIISKEYIKFFGFEFFL